MIKNALAVALVYLSPVVSLLAKQEPAPTFEPTLPWLGDLDEALAASKETGKPILLEFR